MVDYMHYVPILQSKQGELEAIKKLKPEIISEITPLFVVPPRSKKKNKKGQIKTVNGYTDKSAKAIANAWHNGAPLFIDLGYLCLDDDRSEKEHPYRFFHDMFFDLGNNFIPVTGLRRKSSDNKDIKNLIAKGNLGVCFRIESNDFENNDFEKKVSELLKKLNVQPEETDLVIDLSAIKRGQIGPYTRAVESYINQLHNITAWRSLVLSACSFPESLSGIKPKTIKETNRSEWAIWQSIFRKLYGKLRTPTFSDYATVFPKPLELNDIITQPSVKIKYTYEDTWIIAKGEGRKKAGAEQSHRLCKWLVDMSEYCGSQFSWGDEYIRHCSEEKVGPGSLTTWVKVGVNHHITFVVEQLARFFGS